MVSEGEIPFVHVYVIEFENPSWYGVSEAVREFTVYVNPGVPDETVGN